MRIRHRLAVFALVWFGLVFASIYLGVHAHAQSAPEKKQVRPSFGDLGVGQLDAKDAEKEIALTGKQQRPIIRLLRERELIDAKIQGAIGALMAFLDLSPTEWDCVEQDGQIKLVRRPAPNQQVPQGESK